jgi:hypothetical protein
MTKNRLRFLIPAFLILWVCSPSSLAGAAIEPFSGNLPKELAYVLSDTVREGEPLLRPAAETLQVSRRILLVSAFETLGWGHELSLAEKLCPGKGLDCLSRFTTPRPPSVFLDFPDETPSKDDLLDILNWIRACRESIAWDFVLSGETTTLRLHRNGISAPGDPWEIRLQENLDETEALRALHEIASTDSPVALRKTSQDRFNVVVGPFSVFAEAGKSFAALPPFPGMHLAPAPTSPVESPLFWAAILAGDLESAPVIRFASEIGVGRADLSTLASAFRAEAGINGGFFSGPLPIGTLVVEGKLLHGPQGERSAIGLNRGKTPVFGNGYLSLRLVLPDMEQPLDRFNENPREDETSVLLDDDRFSHPFLPESGDLVAMPVTVEIHGSLSLGPRRGTLLARGRKSKTLQGILPGEKVEILSEWSDSLMAGRELVLQAGPRLLENGIEKTDPESFDEKTRLQKHPRTLVGWDGKSTWWIVVDGRQASHSQGLTLPETAGLALSLGLKDALNLDGGGSSSLWWNGFPINLPSGGKERPLPYAILFGTSSPFGSLTR